MDQQEYNVPTPGPGKNGIKPNGLVLARFITSLMSISIFLQICFISFTSPIFTDLKIFSNIFVVSAISIELDLTTELQTSL